MKNELKTRLHNADEMLLAVEQIYRDIIEEASRIHGGRSCLSHDMKKDWSYVASTLSKGKILRLKKVAHEAVKLEVKNDNE